MIRSDACWFPGLFLLNDFTVPGGAIKQGRRQEPCYTPYHPRTALSNTFARLPAVLLRLAIQEREQQNPFPRFTDNDYARRELFRIEE
jgi:hypothetical protein